MQISIVDTKFDYNQQFSYLAAHYANTIKSKLRQLKIGQASIYTLVDFNPQYAIYNYILGSIFFPSSS